MKSTIEAKMKGFANKIRRWGSRTSSNSEIAIFELKIYIRNEPDFRLNHYRNLNWFPP